jgi:hypothetical protein
VQLVVNKLLYAEVLSFFSSQWDSEIWMESLSLFWRIIRWQTTHLCRSQDRKKTLQQIDDFFNKKVAPTELVDEIKVVIHLVDA